jgi:hypothetical protein
MASSADQPLAGAFVDRHEALGALAIRAGDLIQMRRLFREHVPPGLSLSSEVANFRQGIVVISAGNSAIAAKLKQLTPRLISLFVERGWQVSAIQVRVQDRASP